MVIISEGPWGIQWKEFDAPLSDTHLLHFTCKFCGRVSMGLSPDIHFDWCEHPHAGGEG